MELALEEESREALRDFTELALDDARDAVLREELAQHALERRDEIDLDLRAIGLGGLPRRGGRVRVLEHLELRDDLRGDRVELGARLELALVVHDARLELLVAELQRDLGERELRARGHFAFGGRDGACGGRIVHRPILSKRLLESWRL